MFVCGPLIARQICILAATYKCIVQNYCKAFFFSFWKLQRRRCVCLLNVLLPGAVQRTSSSVKFCNWICCVRWNFRLLHLMVIGFARVQILCKVVRMPIHCYSSMCLVIPSRSPLVLCGLSWLTWPTNSLAASAGLLYKCPFCSATRKLHIIISNSFWGRENISISKLRS